MNLSYEKLGNDEADIVVVYLALMRSGQIASEVLNHIKENRAEMDCLFVTVWVPESEWGDLLTPWPEKEKAGSVTSFGGRAKEMYDWLCDSLIPQICQDSKKQKEDIRWVLGGYSLYRPVCGYRGTGERKRAAFPHKGQGRMGRYGAVSGRGDHGK